MTDATKWGDLIPTNGKRPEWLRDDEVIMVVWFSEGYLPNCFVRSLSGWNTITAIRLPADHTYYTFLRLTKEDPRPWLYSPGSKPECEVSCVMIRNGRVYTDFAGAHWSHRGYCVDIIAYLPAESDLRKTKEEWLDEWNTVWKGQSPTSALLTLLRKNSLILPDPTPLDKFTAA